ncbi:MAG: SCO family protein [Pseudomonadota bacterium]
MAILHKISPLLYALALVALGAFAWVNFISPRLDQSLADQLGQGDYALVTTGGDPFTERTLRQRPSAVFFGFTHCPEICPTTLADMSFVQEEMGLSPQDLAIYFITVDPERDTPAVLKDYVEWVPGAQGVTGSPEDVQKAVSAFRAYSRRVPLDDGDYTMDHSAYVMLFDDRGRFFEPIGYQEDFDRTMDKIRRLLNS